jgi:hypothetical protein
MEHLATGPGAQHGDALVAAVEQRRGRVLGVRSADRRQGPAELGGSLGAIAGLERQRGGEDDGQVGRRVAGGVDLTERAHRVDAGQLAGAQLVERDPEAVHIEALVRRHQARLHRHVGGRADRHACIGPPTRRLGRRIHGLLVPALVRRATPKSISLTTSPTGVVGRAHEVPGLHVAVDHAPRCAGRSGRPRPGSRSR